MDLDEKTKSSLRDELSFRYLLVIQKELLSKTLDILSKFETGDKWRVLFERLDYLKPGKYVISSKRIRPNY